MTPLLLVAIRTEGSEPARDLVEIAVARCDPSDGSHTDVYMARVRTSRGAAVPSDAVPLEEAMDRVRELGRGCVFTAWEASATRTFLDDLCLRWELAPLEFSSYALDLQSLAWMLAMVGDARSARLEDIASALEITFAPQACTLEDVRVVGEVYRQLKDRQEQLSRLAHLAPNDRALLETLIERLGSTATPPGVVILELSPGHLLELSPGHLLDQARQAYTALKDRVSLASFTALKDRAVTGLKSRWASFTGNLGFGGTS
jgi:hypothetical protein